MNRAWRFHRYFAFNYDNCKRRDSSEYETSPCKRLFLRALLRSARTTLVELATESLLVGLSLRLFLRIARFVVLGTSAKWGVQSFIAGLLFQSAPLSGAKVAILHKLIHLFATNPLLILPCDFGLAMKLFTSLV
mmetsp:Transcript_15888/g.50656  ORF Transcript_15888/g.50656 Transcript_15888/m.50656 type:complete len:134 (-) Transcript_15888:956-1357(-)